MKITFLVPSFNGDLHLETTIRSLLRESEKIENSEYEILICLNGSTDGSKLMIENSFQNVRNLRIMHFERNLGYDENLIRAIAHTKSEYIWFVGDDDVILNGASELVLNQLQTHEDLNFILLEPIFFTFDTEIPGMTRQPEVSIATNHIDFFKRVKWNGSALSSIVIRKPEIESFREIQDNYGKNWIHLVLLFERVLLDSMGTSQKYCLISEGTIAVRMLNPRWKENFGNYVVVGIDHIEVLRKLLKKRDGSLYRIFFELRKETNWSDVKSGYRDIHGVIRLKFTWMQIKLFWRYPLFWILTFPLLVLSENPRKTLIKIQEYFLLRVWPAFNILRGGRNG
jgi:glycosyltransferase involved in cell wall biosynthesis